MQELSKAESVAPYFDGLFEDLQNPAHPASIAFGRHVPWGYWPHPDAADGTPEDYANAAEELCQLLCRTAAIRDGARILDVGCGFGGTIASLNERFDNLDMTGVNIDRRQLKRASQLIHARGNNQIRFVHADACQLPFPENSFDMVLAVECIFHFPSRERFFDEVYRVLRSPGSLTLSDILPAEQFVPQLTTFNPGIDPAIKKSYGKVDLKCPLSTYRVIAQSTGLPLVSAHDISRNTQPTYAFLRQQLRAGNATQDAKIFDKATRRLEAASREGWLQYSILRFEKPAAAQASVA